MQKHAAWRQEEQRLLERWAAAAERHRVAHEELSAARLAQGEGAPNDELALKAQAARAEIESLRREVARLKRKFLSGDRY
ncbi:MAG: hypothetical protein ACREU5_03910 [Burkholderiales bacterium]